jgi:hypothetical protein
MNPPAPGRSCAGCTLCCKLLGITELAKPRGSWCPHCDVGVGCRIYTDRPASCRIFNCAWLLGGDTPEHWKPLTSRMVLSHETISRRLVVFVDPTRPDAWRRAPYHADIIAWSGLLASRGGYVLIAAGQNCTVVMPTGAFPLGAMAPEDRIGITAHQGPAGITYDVRVLPPDAPRSTRPPNVLRMN